RLSETAVGVDDEDELALRVVDDHVDRDAQRAGPVGEVADDARARLLDRRCPELLRPSLDRDLGAAVAADRRERVRLLGWFCHGVVPLDAPTGGRTPSVRP